VTPPDDETPLPGALPHHEADPTSQVDRLSSDDLVLEVDPDDLLATRPHPKLDPIEPERDPSELFARPSRDADDFEEEEKTPPPRFLQQPGAEHDQTLPRDRHLLDDDDEDTVA
jgi:hypothetical protein